MGNFFKSFRARIVVLFGVSMVISGGITYIIFNILRWYYARTALYGGDLYNIRQQIRNIGDIYFVLLVFIPLAVIIFYYLTKPYSTYFRIISNGINELSLGNFQHIVSPLSNDEFQGIAQDINLASKKLQEAIEKGEFTESSKDQLVINLAHDLRTPLTSIIGYLDIILNDRNLSEDQKLHFLKISYTKSQRLEKLIEELFEVTKVNYGVLPLNKSQINSTDLILQLVDEMYPIFEGYGVDARVNLTEAMPIFGDGNLLARVFENLIVNAARYGADGLFVDIYGFKQNGEAVFQITNYGSVIPQEDLPYLFDMFYRGDKARTHQKEGNGLGLFIAKNIVEQHGGVIIVKSNVQSTIFEVRLPME